MDDKTRCRQCTSYNAELLAAKTELSELRVFQQEVRDAFGTDDLERLHLISVVVDLAKPAIVQWGMSPPSGATSEAMTELDKAVRAMYESVHPERPEDKAERENMERKQGSYEGPGILDPVNDLHNRDQRGVL